MSEYVMKDQSGSLFKNDKKTDGDNKPDYRGDVMVNGKKMQLSAWIKEGKNGKFMSLSFQEPYVKPVQEQEEKPVAKSNANDFSDDIPW